ncbi:hypothetical protein BpHYR1_028745 [Brachionus plicatilis]|uniref:Uncharacterized protein n=1 Tax=Brachionus plicatilis TaxID=10195 RepID=A0A3M7QKZ4_BRAPC|nr:hypothetical protein BpHYR1_028745 [Brachionus plicatilis]
MIKWLCLNTSNEVLSINEGLDYFHYSIQHMFKIWQKQLQKLFLNGLDGCNRVNRFNPFGPHTLTAGAKRSNFWTAKINVAKRQKFGRIFDHPPFLLAVQKIDRLADRPNDQKNLPCNGPPFPRIEKNFVKQKWGLNQKTLGNLYNFPNSSKN